MANARVDLWTGDCLEVLRGFPDACVDSVVADPPYGLSKPPDVAEVLRLWLADETYEHGSSGFMGSKWDSFVPGPKVWREVLRVLKPGGHALICGHTRMYGLLDIATRLAGFEIRDTLSWNYGQGFPKSQDVGRQIDMDKCSAPGRHYDKNLPKGDKLRAGDHLCPPHPDGDPWRGHGTNLKPAYEPILLVRKPLEATVGATALEHGTGSLNIDACRIRAPEGDRTDYGLQNHPDSDRSAVTYGPWTGPREEYQRPTSGRYPANVLFDEEAAAVLDAQTGIQRDGVAVRHRGVSGGVTSIDRPKPPGTPDMGYGGSGGASRFFYVAKASKAEKELGLEHLPERTPGELTGGRAEGSAGLDSPRAGAGRTSNRKNHHPTVKPLNLMRWMCRLITPPNGIVLDPFMGSGSTGCAAKMEGFGFVGIDLNPEYVEIARARIGARSYEQT